jgi:hypothetical protein
MRAPPMRDPLQPSVDLLALISLIFFVVVVPVGAAVMYYYDVLVYHESKKNADEYLYFLRV